VLVSVVLPIIQLFVEGVYVWVLLITFNPFLGYFKKEHRHADMKRGKAIYKGKSAKTRVTKSRTWQLEGPRNDTKHRVTDIATKTWENMRKIHARVEK
jgi:hypothetical protein